MWTKAIFQRVNRVSYTRLLPHSVSILYKSRRNIGIRDSLRGKNSFPHLIRFPKDYWPTPPGFYCVYLMHKN